MRRRRGSVTILLVALLVCFCSHKVYAAESKSYSLVVSGAGVGNGDRDEMVKILQKNKLFTTNSIYTFTYNTDTGGTKKSSYENAINVAYNGCTKNDTAYFFHSGHGMEGFTKGWGLVLKNAAGVPISWYTYDDLLKKLSSITCKHMVIIIHACESGAVKEAYDKLPTAKKNKISLFWSSSANELSYKNEGISVSVYGQTIIQLLGYDGNLISDTNGDGCVTVRELGENIKDNIDIVTEYHHAQKQTPGYCSANNINTVIYSNRNKNLNLDKSSIVLWKGQSITLTATKKNISGTLKWTTSNSKVATVSSKGKITAKGVGKATIKVTAGGISKTCKVTVKRPTIKLNKSKLTITLGSSVKTQLKASINGASKTVKWKSSNTKIATVSKQGVINPKINGKITISATANGVTAKCVITIKPSVKLNKTSATIYTSGNKTVQLKASVYGKNKTVTWKSSNKKVAIVDKKGKVTAKGVGSAIITATANGIKVTCKVSVKTKKTGNDGVVTYQSLRGKRFVFCNDDGWYYLNFYENKNHASLYIYGGAVNLFRVYWDIDLEENKYQYTVRELKSGYEYDISLVPHKEYAIVSVSCKNGSFNGYDLKQCWFRVINE